MKPEFGMYLRALRLGFYWADEFGFFVRVTDGMSEQHWFVDIAPPVLDQLTRNRTNGHHRVIEDADELVRMSPYLRELKVPEKQVTVLLNVLGELIRQ